MSGADAAGSSAAYRNHAEWLRQVYSCSSAPARQRESSNDFSFDLTGWASSGAVDDQPFDRLAGNGLIDDNIAILSGQGIADDDYDYGFGELSFEEPVFRSCSFALHVDWGSEESGQGKIEAVGGVDYGEDMEDIAMHARLPPLICRQKAEHFY